MTKQEKIDKLRNMDHAFALYSLYTKIPFIECEQATFYDQAYLFETREDAEEAAKRFFDGGDLVVIMELKLVELPDPSGDGKVVPIQRVARNQVREHLTKFPLMGLNAVFFKPAGEPGESLPLDDVLPDDVKKFVNEQRSDLTGVTLTGIYFAQYMRKKDKDIYVVRDRFEEFCVNLARTKLLLPVIPAPENANDQRLDLSKCMMPIFMPQAKPEGEEAKTAEGADKSAENAGKAPEGDGAQTAEGAGDKNKFKPAALGLFSNMDELVAYGRDRIKDVRIVHVDVAELPKIMPPKVDFIMIDPLSTCVTLKVDEIVKIVSDLRKA